MTTLRLERFFKTFVGLWLDIFWASLIWGFVTTFRWVAPLRGQSKRKNEVGITFLFTLAARGRHPSIGLNIPYGSTWPDLSLFVTCGKVYLSGKIMFFYSAKCCPLTICSPKIWPNWMSISGSGLSLQRMGNKDKHLKFVPLNDLCIPFLINHHFCCETF